jgi:hypothetical protein
MNVHEMTRQVERVARRQDGVFTTADLLRIGFTHQMISYRHKGGEWIRLAPETYALASAPSTWRRQYTAAVLSLRDSALAGLAAAKVHGVEGFGVARPELVIKYTGNHRTPLATVHRSASALITTVGGLRVTTIAQTLCDLLPRVALDRWERATDGLLLDRRLTIDELQERRIAYEHSRRPGIATLRALVDERLDTTPTPAESELERLLQATVALRPDIPPVHWQAPAPWSDDERVDGLIPEWGIVLEADGRRWHARVADFETDRWRDNQAAARGLRVMRFTHTHVTQRPEEVAALIAAAGGYLAGALTEGTASRDVLANGDGRNPKTSVAVKARVRARPAPKGMGNRGPRAAATGASSSSSAMYMVTTMRR